MSSAVIVLIIDVIIAGNGKWFESIFLFNSRKAILLLLALLFVFMYLNRGISSKVFPLIFIPIFAFLLWSLVIPIINDVDLNQSISEGLVLLGFALLPLICESKLENTEYIKFKLLILVAIVVNSLVHILMLSSVLGVIPMSEQVISSISKFLNYKNDTSLNIAVDQYGSVRVGWIGSAFIMLGFGWLRICNTSKFLYAILFLIFIFALYISGLRGLFGALILSFVFAKLIGRYFTRSSFALSFAVFCSICCGALTVSVVSVPANLEYFGLSRDISDSTRSEQTELLLNQFLKNPILGKGMGGTVDDYERPEEATYAFEQYLLSLLMKTGSLGMILAFYYIYIWTSYLKSRLLFIDTFDCRSMGETLTFLLLTIFIASASNPYLFNFVGYAYILILVVAVKNESHYIGKANNPLVLRRLHHFNI